MTVMEPNAPITDVESADVEPTIPDAEVDTSAQGDAASASQSDPSAPAAATAGAAAPEALTAEDMPQANGQLARCVGSAATTTASQGPPSATSAPGPSTR
ncbi:MAG: hypothetical protein GEU97_15140 [Actinophytocola sp.]|nr:hypothetical protein [Actinophytocola sp.]